MRDHQVDVGEANGARSRAILRTLGVTDITVVYPHRVDVDRVTQLRQHFVRHLAARAGGAPHAGLEPDFRARRRFLGVVTVGLESIALPPSKGRDGPFECGDELCEVRVIMPGSPEDFGKVIAEETDKWAKVVKFSGAKAE